MRLLSSQLDHDGHFSLTTFGRHDIPKYAILSHTWLADDEEVTFDDIQARFGGEKAGYAKLRFCSERALAAGLDYFWIDSCCIKKTDSAELTESLNSMFAWYARAEVCYAYLVDVSTLKHGRDDDTSRPWMEQFQQSRWHRRGWTLQELLAPKGVEFWSRDNVKLGDRDSLGHDIHHITGIPTAALRGKALTLFSVEVRFDWIKGRHAKVDEDQAYCLLGIFDVSIPIIYGEGKEKAIGRLNDEIARSFRNKLHSAQSQPENSLKAHSLNLRQDNSLSASERRALLLESLKHDTLNARRLGVASAQSGTCRWLLSHPTYNKWEASGNRDHRGFLWIKGKPGAGKSTLMKYIFDQTERSSSSSTIVISFFFNARGAQMEKTTYGMWTALVYQLLSAAPDLQSVLDELPVASTDDPTVPSWTVDVLSTVFEKAVLNLGQRKLKCFVDALDECEEDEIRAMVDRFEQIQDFLADEHKGQLHVCFASRHYPSISLNSGQELILEAQTGHGEDLAKYVHKHLRSRKSKKADAIRERVLEKANGVFMWAVLVIPMLKKDFDSGRIFAVEHRLDELPGKLSALFRDMLKRDGDNLAETLLCYQWILFAARPLTKEEYYYAVLSGTGEASALGLPHDDEDTTEEDMERFVSSSSKGLAELSRSKPTVQFIHESVRDFLLKEDGLSELTSELGSDIESSSHKRLRDCCQVYMIAERGTLSFKISETFEQQTGSAKNKYPFLEYATKYILKHANHAANIAGACEFLEGFDLRRWIEYSNLFERFKVRMHTKDASLLYILAESGCDNLLWYMCRDGPRIGERGERYHYPLFAALANGHHNAARALLQADIEFEAKYEPFQNPHPFTWAMKQGLKDLAVRLLFAKDFEWTPLQSSKPPYRPLDLVVACDSTDLLHHVAIHAGLLGINDVGYYTYDPRKQEKFFKFQTPVARSEFAGDTTALGYAAACGSEPLIRLLIELGAQVRLHSCGYTPMSMALRYGKVATLPLLLEGGHMSINDRFEPGHASVQYFQTPNPTPLEMSITFDRLDMVQWLLEQGVDTRERNIGNGEEPLMLAARLGREAISRLLIGSRVDVRSIDYGGSTALHAASLRGYESIVQMLLARGADIECETKSGSTALHLAAMNNHEGVLKLQLDHIARSETTRTLDLAWPHAIECQVSKNQDSHSSSNILHSPKPTRELIIEARDNQGKTALCEAANHGAMACIEHLLQSGADVDARDSRGRTSLSYAIDPSSLRLHLEAYRERERCVSLLLTHGASIGVVDAEGMTPLLRAASMRLPEIVALLLAYKADTTATTKDGETARDLFPAYPWDSQTASSSS